MALRLLAEQAQNRIFRHGWRSRLKGRYSVVFQRIERGPGDGWR
ncbi:hypothetical protein CLJ1_0766 [Pseudomonas paraeruginosa]|nr:hypothetical protein CLJ1_0766 [Pseudomonas aeruginosa]